MNILPSGRHPFQRSVDPSGARRMCLRVFPPEQPPNQTGLVLACLWGAEEWELVRVEENGFVYEKDEHPADPDEWECWADLTTWSYMDEGLGAVAVAVGSES